MEVCLVDRRLPVGLEVHENVARNVLTKKAETTTDLIFPPADERRRLPLGNLGAANDG